MQYTNSFSFLLMKSRRKILMFTALCTNISFISPTVYAWESNLLGFTLVIMAFADFDCSRQTLNHYSKSFFVNEEKKITQSKSKVFLLQNETLLKPSLLHQWVFTRTKCLNLLQKQTIDKKYLELVFHEIEWFLLRK